MARYKLNIKYWGVCELSFESSKKDVVTREFDRYVNSFLDGDEDVDKFKLDFKNTTIDVIPEKKEPVKEFETEPVKEPEKLLIKEPDMEESDGILPQVRGTAQIVLEPKGPQSLIKKPVEKAMEKPAEKAAQPKASDDLPLMTLSLREYVKNKNITTPLDEFVAGACYLDEILDIKEFTLKQLNAKLVPVFKRVSDLGVAELAKERVLVEAKEVNGVTYFTINQNAWNYHNYDLVRH